MGNDTIARPAVRYDRGSLRTGVPYGPYHLVRKLADGADSELFAATDGAGRACLVRRIRPDRAADEACAAALVAHWSAVRDAKLPGVLPLASVGREGGSVHAELSPGEAVFLE